MAVALVGWRRRGAPPSTLKCDTRVKGRALPHPFLFDDLPQIGKHKSSILRWTCGVVSVALRAVCGAHGLEQARAGILGIVGQSGGARRRCLHGAAMKAVRHPTAKPRIPSGKRKLFPAWPYRCAVAVCTTPFSSYWSPGAVCKTPSRLYRCAGAACTTRSRSYRCTGAVCKTPSRLYRGANAVCKTPSSSYRCTFADCTTSSIRQRWGKAVCNAAPRQESWTRAECSGVGRQQSWEKALCQAARRICSRTKAACRGAARSQSWALFVGRAAAGQPTCGQERSRSDGKL